MADAELLGFEVANIRDTAGEEAVHGPAPRGTKKRGPGELVAPLNLRAGARVRATRLKVRTLLLATQRVAYSFAKRPEALWALHKPGDRRALCRFTTCRKETPSTETAAANDGEAEPAVVDIFAEVDIFAQAAM